MRNYDTDLNDPTESVWRFTWGNAIPAPMIATGLRDTGLQFEVSEGRHVPKRGATTKSATITFQGTPRQAEALFRAIKAKPWAIEDMRVEAYQLAESAEVTFD